MLAWIFNLINKRIRTKLAKIPGPTPRFPFGTLLEFIGKRPWEVCAEHGRRFGGISQIWLFNRPAIVLNDPKLIGEVLDTHARDYYKDDPVLALKPVITSSSLFITNFGQGWEQARQENPFSTIDYSEWLSKQVKPIREITSATIKSWSERTADQPVDLYWDMQRLMFDIFAKVFWGRTFPSDRFDWFQTLARTGDRRMAPIKPFLPPLSPFFYRARKKWYSSFEQLVAETRKNPNPTSPDQLNLVLARGTSLSDSTLAESLATNFFGGVFSSTSTVNTTIYLLGKHPLEADKVARAVQVELPGDYDRASLDQCRTLECAIRESMRYLPAVPLYFRRSSPNREVSLGNYMLPPNTQLFISNWYLHKYSTHWAEPERFDPSRWERGFADVNPYGSDFFFPFGRGPRTCIGAGFGQFIHRLVLAEIYRATEPVVAENHAYQQSFFFGTMMPKNLKVQFKPRSPFTEFSDTRVTPVDLPR